MPTKIGNAEIRAAQFGLVKLLWQGVGAGAAVFSAQTPISACGFTVTRTGVGLYSIIFSEKWDGAVAFIQGMIYNAGTPRGGTVEMQAKYDPAVPDVDIAWVSDAGAAEDIAVGDELWLEVTMNNRDTSPRLTPV